MSSSLAYGLAPTSNIATGRLPSAFRAQAKKRQGKAVVAESFSRKLSRNTLELLFSLEEADVALGEASPGFFLSEAFAKAHGLHGVLDEPDSEKPVVLILLEGGKWSEIPIETAVSDPRWYVRVIAFDILGQVFERHLRGGRAIPLEKLQVGLKDEDPRVRQLTAKHLIQLHRISAGKDQKADLSPTEEALLHLGEGAWLDDDLSAPLVKKGDVEVWTWKDNLDVNSPKEIYGAVVTTGRRPFSALIKLLDSTKESPRYVRNQIAWAMAELWTDAAKKGRLNSSRSRRPLEKLERSLSEALEDGISVAEDSMARIYASLPDRRWADALLSERADYFHIDTPVKGGKPRYYFSDAADLAWIERRGALVLQGKLPLNAFEDDAKNWPVGGPWVSTLARTYRDLVLKGKLSIEHLRSKRVLEPVIEVAAFRALNDLYLIFLSQGKEVDLEEHFGLPAGQIVGEDYRSETFEVDIEIVYKFCRELLRQNRLEKEDYERYALWEESGLPALPDVLREYRVSPNPRAFVSALKLEAEGIISKEFDLKNLKHLLLASLGTRVNGVDVCWSEFEERMAEIEKFETAYPGTFKRIFSKAQGLKVIEVSGKEARQIDTSRVNPRLFEANRKDLLSIKMKTDGLEWLSKEFQGSKVFNLRNLYYQLKRAQALKSGLLKEGERFRVEFPSEKKMREEILEDNRLFHRIVFELAKDRLGEPAQAERLIPLMRNLIVSDALSDIGLFGRMGSANLEEQIQAFKIFYEDYRNHLPDAVGAPFDRIKGLKEAFGELSQGVYAELDKVTVMKHEAVETYRFVPVGFLGLFRGRAGIIDCSFDDAAAYTRAMHEDTLYYFVYKGSELKGYIGLAMARHPRLGKILAIDTIQSPSLDGKDLLLNVFKALDGLARDLGAVGIALPERDALRTSFNFDNEDTVLRMPLYRKGTRISLKPLHLKSWLRYTKMFGPDSSNSLEPGDFPIEPRPFRLLKLDPGKAERPAERQAEPAAEPQPVSDVAQAA